MGKVRVWLGLRSGIGWKRPQHAFGRLALRGNEVGAELAHVKKVEVLRLVRKKLVVGRDM